MPDTGWISPASGTEEATTAFQHPSANWQNIALAYDGDTATNTQIFLSKSDLDSPALVFSGFGFDALIPSGAVIDGLEVRIVNLMDNRHWYQLHHIFPGFNELEYKTIAQYKCNRYAAVPFFTTYSAAGVDEFTDVLGGSTELWGASSVVLDAALRNAGFGLAYGTNGTTTTQYGHLREISARVHYTGGASDPMSVREGGVWKTASPFVRDGGIWKPATPSTKDGGIWKAS